MTFESVASTGGYQCLRDLRAMTLSVGSGSCNIRLVCTIHASASDLSRKPGIRLHLPLRLFISTLNECPFSEITRYAMLVIPPSMARRNWDCRADAITTSDPIPLPAVDGIDGWAEHVILAGLN